MLSTPPHTQRMLALAHCLHEPDILVTFTAAQITPSGSLTCYATTLFSKVALFNGKGLLHMIFFLYY